METPIWDFVRQYAASDTVRLHMPGHKGRAILGCEALDITEIHGADALYEASGIIAQSEANASAMFGSGRTLYSTEGSSQCIRAMLHLALLQRPQGSPPRIVAARNVHRAFVYAAALLDMEVVWLWPEKRKSLCSCPVTPSALEAALQALETPPAGVYVTSPDYLGGLQDLAGLAQVCRRWGVPLLVDNAHGAYLHFLEHPCHPLDLGATMCCDSAHKTLPVLTGGAYLHLAKDTSPSLQEAAKTAMALFGSTSPSYLTLSSLDLCNRALSQEYPSRIGETASLLEQVRGRLRELGWQVEESDPLRLTLVSPQGCTGTELADKLRQGGIECEYADDSYLVCMATPENTPEDLWKVPAVLGENSLPPAAVRPLPILPMEQACSIRQAVFSPHQTVEVQQALGRVCASPTVACPPAIPIAVSGERISEEAVEVFCHYGVSQVDVVRDM